MHYTQPHYLHPHQANMHYSDAQYHMQIRDAVPRVAIPPQPHSQYPHQQYHHHAHQHANYTHNQHPSTYNNTAAMYAAPPYTNHTLPVTPEREVELKRKINRLRQEQIHSFHAIRVGELCDCEFELERLKRTRS
jgi:hypothetical protein